MKRNMCNSLKSLFYFSGYIILRLTQIFFFIFFYFLKTFLNEKIQYHLTMGSSQTIVWPKQRGDVTIISY